MRPKVAERYLARLGTPWTAATRALSTDFWSAAFSAGNAFFSFSPSLKNSPSVPERFAVFSFEK